VTYTTVHMSDWKPDKKHRRCERSLLQRQLRLRWRRTPLVKDKEPDSPRLVRQFQAGFKLSAEDLPLRLSATIS
jgi:hypothetical protein